MRPQRSYSTEAIILKRTDLGEADRIVTLFTPTKGKMHVIAKGTRRPISKLAGHLELLSRSQLQIALGRNLDIVTQAEGRENFFHLRTEIWHMTCGFYLAEMADRFLEEKTQHLAVYKLLLETLRALDAHAIEVQQQRANGTLLPGQERVRSNLLMRYFEMHLLSHIGYQPALRKCVHCTSEIQGGENGFAPALGGILCPQCSHLWVHSLSLNALRVLRFLQSNVWADVPQLRLDAALQHELEGIMHGLLRFHLERDLKSWGFLEMLSMR